MYRFNYAWLILTSRKGQRKQWVINKSIYSNLPLLVALSLCDHVETSQLFHQGYNNLCNLCNKLWVVLVYPYFTSMFLQYCTCSARFISTRVVNHCLKCVWAKFCKVRYLQMFCFICSQSWYSNSKQYRWLLPFPWCIPFLSFYDINGRKRSGLFLNQTHHGTFGRLHPAVDLRLLMMMKLHKYQIFIYFLASLV